MASKGFMIVEQGPVVPAEAIEEYSITHGFIDAELLAIEKRSLTHKCYVTEI